MVSSLSLRTVLPNIPEELVDALQIEFAELESRYARGDWGPTKLNGGRLAEAILRYLEWRQSGTYTPIGKKLNRSSVIGQTRSNTSIPDGLRMIVTTCVEILMDVRNRRDVAHLGADIDVKEMDSILVFRVASWVLAEIIREESGLSHTAVQNLIDRLSKKQIPLVEEIGGDLIVLGTHLIAIDRALVALYRGYPDPLEVAILRQAVQYQNSSRFMGMLQRKQREGLIYMQGDQVYLTGKGVAWVEDNIDISLQI